MTRLAQATIVALLLVAGPTGFAWCQSPAPAAAGGMGLSALTAEFGPNPSLIFSDTEYYAIKKAINDHEHPVAMQQQEQSVQQAVAQQAAIEAAQKRLPNIYLSAVLDFGDGDWTVWANGYRVTPGHQPALFRVMGVNGNVVDIVVPGEGGDRFQLEPYQTWRSQQRDVVEGIYP